jgi:hypothetical protein
MNAKEKFLKSVSERATWRKPSMKIAPTMLQINGILYHTQKGKCLWKTPGYAKLALRCDFDDFARYDRSLDREGRALFYQEVLSVTEFVSVDISEEMVANLKF